MQNATPGLSRERRWRGTRCCFYTDPTGLSLHSGQRDPLDKQPLRQEEDDDDGQHGHQGGSHHIAPADVVDAAEEVESQGEYVLGLVVEVDQRLREIVSGGPKAGNRHCGHRRVEMGM